MRALPHLLARLHRRLALQMLRAREQQLATLISEIEAEIIARHDLLAVLRSELSSVLNRLSVAHNGDRTTHLKRPWTR